MRGGRVGPAITLSVFDVSFLSNRAQRREFPMRTSINFAVTNGNVIGLGQDRVVSSNDTCAHAAQHLPTWHARKRGRGTWCFMKRYAAAMAGAALEARHLCLVITGPQGQRARRTSPALVTA
jgi:hypothetical protein